MHARSAHRYYTLLLHATRGVMEVCKLHGHLVVDGQEELLSLLQLGLQLFTFRGIQLWGSCWKMVP